MAPFGFHRRKGFSYSDLYITLFIVSLQLLGRGLQVSAGNEDGDTLHNQVKSGHKYSYVDETGLRLTESRYGIPVTIDNLFTQISFSLDDQGQNSDSDCVSGSDLSELDMCLTPSQARMFDSVRPGQMGTGRRKRQASANGFSLWKNGVIPYVFNTTFPATDRDAILSAMSEWEKATCVRFRPANMEDNDIVVFRDGRRCSTNIGRIGREQAVTLAKTCRSKRILIHELGHVIGLIHEHQRHDRDKYVKVLLENVRNMSQERYQFSKLLTGSITNKAVKYDYTSVMHYGRNYFAKSPELTTLQTTDTRFQDVIGRAEKPSFRDVETVNRLYQCSAGCPHSLHCGDACFMDRFCICRCPTGTDKAFFGGPGPYQNNLPDPTCEFFASRGECTGNIKDTVRPLCAKSCGLYHPKHRPLPPPIPNGVGAAPPPPPPTTITDTWPTPVAAATSASGNSPMVMNQLQAKAPGPSWGSQSEVQPMGGPGSSATGTNIVNNVNNAINDVMFDPMLAGSRVSAIRGRAGLQSQFQQEQQPYIPLSEGQGRIISSQQQTVDLPGSPVMNFRAALLQRQTALSSSEPPMYGSLVMTRTSNGRTARLLLPSRVNSRSLARSRASIYSPRINFLQRDSTISPSARRGNNGFGSSSFPSWLAMSGTTSQYARQSPQNIMAAATSASMKSPRQSLQRTDIYDRVSFPGSARASGLGSMGYPQDNNYHNRELGLGLGSQQGANGRPMPYQQNKLMLQTSSNSRNEFGAADRWQKGFGPSIIGQNLPVALAVDRAQGPLPLADFGGPEFGQGGDQSNAQSAKTYEVGGTISGQNLQTIGPSFMKSGGTIPQNFLLKEGNPSDMNSQNLWDQQASQPPGQSPPQNTPLLDMPNNPTFTGQGSLSNYDPGPIPGPVNDPLQQSFEPSLSQSSNSGSNIGPSSPHYSNNEPYIDTLSFNNQPGVPIDHVALSDAHSNTQHLSQSLDGFSITISPLRNQNVALRDNTNMNHNNGAGFNSPRHIFNREPFIISQNWRPSPNQQQQLALYQRLNNGLAFTDPSANRPSETISGDQSTVSSHNRTAPTVVSPNVVNEHLGLTSHFIQNTQPASISSTARRGLSSFDFGQFRLSLGNAPMQSSYSIPSIFRTYNRTLSSETHPTMLSPYPSENHNSKTKVQQRQANHNTGNQNSNNSEGGGHTSSAVGSILRQIITEQTSDLHLAHSDGTTAERSSNVAKDSHRPSHEIPASNFYF